MTTDLVYYKQNLYHFLKTPYKFKNHTQTFQTHYSPDFYTVQQGLPAALPVLGDSAVHFQQKQFCFPMQQGKP